MINITELEQPFYLMLCGLPASGKTTLRRKIREEFVRLDRINNPSVLSTDDEIEYHAKFNQITYNEAFLSQIKIAEKVVFTLFTLDIEHNNNMLDDRTNLTVNSRRKKLARLPKHYNKYAIYINIPEFEIWKKRLNSRPGKVIPENVLNNMQETLVIPTVEEGFSKVWIL
jgi:tRNA uridine 5-carbamoylmethylation protein Kti12